MENRPNWALLARYVAEECSRDEERRVNEWIRADPSRKQLIAELQSIWDAADSPSRPATPEIDVEEDWQEMRSEMESAEPESSSPPADAPRSRSDTRAPQRPSRRRGPGWGAGVAVGLLLLLGGLWLAQSLGGAAESAYRTVVTKQGERSRIQLADGSSVMLNVDSKIRLPSSFNQDKRVVQLTGEAYFEVEADADRPFIVKTDDASVKVRGTAFNVRGYPDDEQVQVAVTEGGVSFQPEREGNEMEAVTLNSGEVGWMAEADTTIQTEVADVYSYIGWTEGRLIFEDTPLPEVAKRLERWYSLQFRIQDAGLQSLRLTATLKSESVENVLDVITASLDIRYRIEGDTVVLMAREQATQRTTR